MTASLGWQPAQVDVNIGRDTDFVQTITRTDGAPWPVGASIHLVIDLNGVQIAAWAAALAGANATWHIARDEVNAVLDLIRFKAATSIVVYSDPSITQTWMAGKVVTFGG